MQISDDIGAMISGEAVATSNKVGAVELLDTTADPGNTNGTVGYACHQLDLSVR